VTYEALVQFSPSGTDEVSVGMTDLPFTMLKRHAQLK
jgi:hypothetical protein